LRNLTPGGENPPSGAGKPKSENFKRLLTERNWGNKWGLGNKNRLGKPHTAETKEKQRIASLGRLHTVEAKAKMSAALAGRPKSAAHKEKLRIAATGKTASLASREKMRTFQLDCFLKTVAWG